MLGGRYWEAHALNCLAISHWRLGDPHTADRLHAEAVAVLDVPAPPRFAVLRR
jgi:hypothetical protein